MQEKIRIQSHLQKLREQCIRDYLSTKLESIASKEVINDILMGFLEANNKQFLENITETILEVKNNNKKLKQKIQSLRMEYEKEEVKARVMLDEQKQKMRERLSLIQAEYEEKMNQREKIIEKLSQQFKRAQQTNKRLTLILDQKQKTIRQLVCSIDQIKLSQINQLIHNQPNKNAQIQLLKGQYQSKLKLLHKQFNSQRQRIIDKNKLLVDQYELTIQNLNHSIKNISEQNKRITAIAQQLRQKYEFQVLTTKNEQILNQKLEVHLKQIKEFFQTKSKQLYESHSKIGTLKQQNLNLLKLKQINNHKHTQQIKTLQKQLQHCKTVIQQQGSQISNLNSLNKTAIREKIDLEQSSQKKNLQLLAVISKRQQEIQILKLQLNHIVLNHQKLEQTLQMQSQRLFLSQQQIKVIMGYNQIQQQEITKYEAQIITIRRQCQAQIDTYQQTFELNIKALQDQLSQSHEQSNKLRDQCRQANELLLDYKNKEIYYQLYLQQIAFLKRQLSKYQQMKKSSKQISFHSQVKQIYSVIKVLSNQNRQLRSFCINGLSEMKEQFDRNINFMIDKVRQNSIRCLYCQHQNKMIKTQKSPTKLIFLDRTIPKSNIDTSSNSIKKNLKLIQEKYRLINHQNQSFSNRIDSIINKH